MDRDRPSPGSHLTLSSKGCGWNGGGCRWGSSRRPERLAECSYSRPLTDPCAPADEPFCFIRTSDLLCIRASTRRTGLDTLAACSSFEGRPWRRRHKLLSGVRVLEPAGRKQSWTWTARKPRGLGLNSGSSGCGILDDVHNRELLGSPSVQSGSR